MTIGAGSPDAARNREREIRAMIAGVMREYTPRLRGHKILLFGSRAAGTARPRSDFDIGVIGEHPLPLRDFYEIEDRLDALPTLYRIDWVDLNRAAPSLRQRALDHAEVIHE